jgi:hypothetical protein
MNIEPCNYHLDEEIRSILGYANYIGYEVGDTLTIEPSGEDILRVQSLIEQIDVFENSHEHVYSL